MRTWIAVVAAMLLPTFASADYLPGVTTQALEPYVLLVIDNSTSMYCQDGLYAADGITPTGHGLYETGACTPNYCAGPSYTGGGNSCPATPSLWPQDDGYGCDCPSRADVAREILPMRIAATDGISFGLMRYGAAKGLLPANPSAIAYEDPLVDKSSCEAVLDHPVGTSKADVVATMQRMVPSGSTPMAFALEKARDHLQSVAASDPSAACRKYYVLLVTDGGENCDKSDGTYSRLYGAVESMRNLEVGGTTIDVRTFVLGFSPGAFFSADAVRMNEMAKRGGTSLRAGSGICKPSAHQPCTDGTAVYASTPADLDLALTTILEEASAGTYTASAPVVASVPIDSSEIDRVSRNLLVYGGFDMPGWRGHLYGVRLFEETSPHADAWTLTDFTTLDLTKCGEGDNPCLYDVGARLAARTKERLIFSAMPGQPVKEDGVPEDSDSPAGAFTLPLLDAVPLTRADGASALEEIWGAYSAIPAIERAGETARHPIDSLPSLVGFEMMTSWLHGDARDWPLGDIYHASAAVVGRPPYSIRTHGYMQFKDNHRFRPHMIYVGANDGMIHAFHANDDLDHVIAGHATSRWSAGDEAWAYLPVSLLHRAASVIVGEAAGEQRFFSNDLSCRIDDVLTTDNVSGGALNCGSDPDCGWKTVLLCGQGWGGSWYVALDVSDPLDPKPLYEATHTGKSYAGGRFGLGRTWSVPSVAQIALEGVPTFVAIFGSGYNTDQKDHGGSSRAAYRLLNEPFDGAFPVHGNGTYSLEKEQAHVYVMNAANGHFLGALHQPAAGAIVADIPTIDVTGDGFVDVAYVGGFSGTVGRVAFLPSNTESRATSPSDWSSSCSKITDFGANRPVTMRPSLFTDRGARDLVYLFPSAGIDRGGYPDEQTMASTTYDLRAYALRDDGGEDCPLDAVSNTAVDPDKGNVCSDSDGVTINGSGAQNVSFADGRRLLGAPLLSVQPNGNRWLSFTTWEPTTSGACGNGRSALYCLNVSDPGRCTPCGDLDPEKTGEEISVELEEGRKPAAPITADGQLYVVGANGPERIANEDGTQGGVLGGEPKPNANAPRVQIVSWREIF